MGTKLKSYTTCHSPIDGHIEVKNRILGTPLRILIKRHTKVWDLLLPHADFAYNKVPSKATGISPFKVLYGVDPLSPLDFVPQPFD